MKKHTDFILAGLFMLALIVPFMFRAYQQYRYAQDTLAWPSTSGVITALDVDSFSARAAAKGKRRPHWALDVKYTYPVGPDTLLGKKVWFYGNVTQQRLTAEDLQDQFAPGAAVPVFYNPADPHDAVLVPGAGEHRFLQAYMLVGLLLGIGCLGWGIALYRATRKA